MTKFVLKKKEQPPPQHEYRVVIQAFEDDELIAQAGATAHALEFTEALMVIDTEVQQQWIKIKQHGSIANERTE